MTDSQQALIQQLLNGLITQIPQEFQPLAQNLSTSLASLASDELEQAIQGVTAAIASGSDPLAALNANLPVAAFVAQKQALTPVATQMSVNAAARAQAEQQIISTLLSAGLKALLAAI